MKMEKTIYIKCDKRLFSRNSFIAVLFACAVVSGVSILFNFYQIITELSSYLILTICSLLTVFSLFNLIKEQQHHYIFLNDDEIWFTNKGQNEAVCLKFEKLESFETKFSKIIFSTKTDEKIVLELNAVADEKKRWQIKEFLKTHITQQKR